MECTPRNDSGKFNKANLLIPSFLTVKSTKGGERERKSHMTEKLIKWGLESITGAPATWICRHKRVGRTPASRCGTKKSPTAEWSREAASLRTHRSATYRHGGSSPFSPSGRGAAETMAVASGHGRGGGLGGLRRLLGRWRRRRRWTQREGERRGAEGRRAGEGRPRNPLEDMEERHVG